MKGNKKDPMATLVALIKENDDAKKEVVAQVAAGTVTQFEKNGNFPYTDIKPAREKGITVIEGPNTFPENNRSPVVHKLQSNEGKRLVGKTLKSTRKEMQENLADAISAIDSDIEVAIKDENVAEEILGSDQFIDSLAEVTNQFGSIYRLYNFTGWGYGSPVRSTQQLNEIRSNICRTDTHSVYVVKLNAQRRQ